MGIGKYIGQNYYFHIDFTRYLDEKYLIKLKAAIEIAKKKSDLKFNIVKFTQSKVSLLNYPGFWDDPFPVLTHSCSINLSTSEYSYIDYSGIQNPYILHRKELLIPTDHINWPEWAALTATAEAEGLFTNTSKIGRNDYWKKLLKSKNLYLVGHQLFSEDDKTIVDRHKTALTRYSLSKPFRFLMENDYLSGQYTIFDYGCGKGSDIKFVSEMGVQINGWDPFYSPNQTVIQSDIVNLGYVLNVIEKITERTETLKKSAALANKLLVVSVMLEKKDLGKAVVHRDGVITSKNTFQKYFKQEEIKNYILSVLKITPVSFGPGIIGVFFDEQEEQKYLDLRYTSKTWRGKKKLLNNQNEDELISKYQDIIYEYCNKCFELGRPLYQQEALSIRPLIEELGTWRRTTNYLLSLVDKKYLREAEKMRKSDLIVLLSLNEYMGRIHYKHLTPRLKHDFKYFFDSYKKARKVSQELLHNIGNSYSINEACEDMVLNGYGYIDSDGNYIFESEQLNFLSPILRIYTGIGLDLYGVSESIDLIKIHVESQKLTLMVFDDYQSNPLPRMLERIKIDMKNQNMKFFDYVDDYEPEYLFLKSRYMRKSSENFEKQLAFDLEIKSLGIEDYGNYGPKPKIFSNILKSSGIEIHQYNMKLVQNPPNLDSSCGRYFKFRDLIECGETQQQQQIANLPKQAETFEALGLLARLVIDPVCDYFGRVTLTYGFCSRELAKMIPGRIEPRLDQHSSCEKNTRGNLICKRKGAAVDFIIDNESMVEVAKWIAINTPFDRLYLYGDDLPLHVSYGPENSGQIIIMSKLPGQKQLMPKVVKLSDFLDQDFILYFKK